MNSCQPSSLGTSTNVLINPLSKDLDDSNISRENQLIFLSSQMSLNDTIEGLVKMLKYYKDQVSVMESKIREHELNNRKSLPFDLIPNLSLAAKEFGKIILSDSAPEWPCVKCMKTIKSHIKSMEVNTKPMEIINLMEEPVNVELDEGSKFVPNTQKSRLNDTQLHKDSLCDFDENPMDNTDMMNETVELIDVDFQTTILGKYECEKCDVKTDTYKQLIRHLIHHRDVNIYECERCGKEFHLGHRYRDHMLIYQLERPFVCGNCGKDFKTSRYLSRHELTHLTEKVLSCPKCDKMFCHKKAFREHFLMQHYKRICPVCSATFYSRAPFNKHMNQAHASEHSKRPQQKQANADGGKRKIKPNRPRTKPKKRLHKYPCEKCGKLMSSENGLNFHIKNVHDLQRPFACSYCPKSFATSHFLVDHMQSHINEKDSAVDSETREKYLQYACDQCDRSFTAARKLKEHKILHSGMREHKCDFCDKSFALKPYLKRHVRLLHQTSHPLNVICGICSKVSVSGPAHKSHMLSHTGETPYHCSVCDAKFRYVKSLRIHVKNKHNC